jgi:hypothetical protein
MVFGCFKSSHSWKRGTFPAGAMPVMLPGYAYSYPSPYWQAQPIVITSPPPVVQVPVLVSAPTPIPVAVPSPMIQTSAIALHTTYQVVAQSSSQVPSTAVVHTPRASPDRRLASPQPPHNDPSSTGDAWMLTVSSHQAQASPLHGFNLDLTITPPHLSTPLPTNLPQPAYLPYSTK